MEITEEKLEEIITKAVAKASAPSHYMSRAQIAKELHVSVPVVKAMEANGLPVKQLSERVFRFVRTEVDAWISSNPMQKAG